MKIFFVEGTADDGSSVFISRGGDISPRRELAAIFPSKDCAAGICDLAQHLWPRHNWRISFSFTQ